MTGKKLSFDLYWPILVDIVFFFLQKVMKKRQSHLTFFVFCNLLLLLLFHFNGLKYLSFSLLLSFFVSLCFIWCVDVCLWVIDNLIFSILSKENFSRFSFFSFLILVYPLNVINWKVAFLYLCTYECEFVSFFFAIFFISFVLFPLLYVYNFFPPLIFQWYMIMGGIDFQASSLFAVVVNCLFHFYRYFHLMFLFCVVWDNPIFIY